MNNDKIEDCEVCMEKFPLDCFEFFPCAHKICFFCYNKLKQLQCPYCRIQMNIEVRIKSNHNVQSDQSNQRDQNNPSNQSTNEENELINDFENDNFDLPELPISSRNNRNNRNNVNNRNYSERFST
jgi:hypothetical protein